eukprot:g5822.t1
MCPWKTPFVALAINRIPTAIILLLLYSYSALGLGINPISTRNITDSQEFHNVLKNGTFSHLLLKGDVELRNYYGWLIPIKDKDIIRVNGSMELSSGLGDISPRPRCDLDGHPLDRMVAGHFTLTSKRMHYTNVDLPPGSTIRTLVNSTVILEDSIVEVFVKSRIGGNLASRWKYLRALMEDASSFPLRTGVRVTDWWCERNEGISCPYGGVYFSEATLEWNKDFRWKLKSTLIKFVQKSEFTVSISSAFLLAIQRMKNYIYLPYDIALDFGVCKKKPIVTNTTVYDPNRSLPPNLVINFQERLYGCLEVYGEHTVRFADFILRNIFSQEGWPVVFPFIHSDPGATVILENVIIEMDANFTFQMKTLRHMVKKIKHRIRPLGLGQGEQRLTVWQERDCLQHLHQTRNCRVHERCPKEAECPSGAIFIEDASFLIEKGDGNDDLGIGMRYHIRHSLITVVPAELPIIVGTENTNQTFSQEAVAESNKRIEKNSNVIGIMCIFLFSCGVLTLRRGAQARTVHQQESQNPVASPNFVIKAAYEAGDPINLAAEAATEALLLKKLEICEDYQLRARAGSFGKVFKATWNGATVAVKVVVHDGLSYLGTSAQREASLSSDLHHPNIVQTFLQITREIRADDILPTPSNDEGCSSDVRGSGAPPYQQGGNGETNSEEGAAAGYFTMNDLAQDRTLAAAVAGPLPDHFGGGLSTDNGDSTESVTSYSGDRMETWMIQEFCDMGSLEKAIRKGKFIRNSQLDMMLVVETCVDICRGMIYLNDRKIIHRDLKSSNILLNGSLHEEKGFIAKVADFGLSRELEMHASHIKTQTTGTVTHMPPELFKEEKLTSASDVYSFGIVMWELVSKESPLEGVPHFLIIKKILYDNWRPTFDEGIPPCYSQLAQNCWAEDSSQRPTIQQVLIELERMRKLFLEEEIASTHAII